MPGDGISIYGIGRLARYGLNMKPGVVVSDLHLFSRRSIGEALLADLGALAEAETLVLNGDSVDFRWSRLPTEHATIAAALAWLEGLLDSFQGSSIHYILGNHDCLAEFREPLADLARRRPVLRIHEDRLRLDRNLFLHGDCTVWKMDEAALKRFRDAWSRDRPRGRFSKSVYDAVDASGISRRFHRWYFPAERTVRRVAHHLDHVMPDWRGEIDHCFFGHTHQPFSGFSLDGVNFHNTGSGIREMGFLPLTFQTP